MNKPRKQNLLIIKVGTNTLKTNDDSELGERLDHASFDRIGQQARRLSDAGYSVIIVSSGAITAGALADGKRREDLVDVVEEQRYATRGWDILVQQWKKSIGAHRVSSALLTKYDLDHVDTRAQALAVIARCHHYGDIVIVNENDAITNDEIKIGDNDQLAAQVAATCATSGNYGTTSLILLTDVHGFNEIADDDSTLIRKVTSITDIEPFAGGAKNHHSKGGMATKLKAARIARDAGVETFIAHGRADNAISHSMSGKIGTHFEVVPAVGSVKNTDLIH